MIRLYRAVCLWLEADAIAKSDTAHDPGPQPEGNNFSQAEHAHSYTSEPELHNGNGRRDYYFEDRMGFRPNPPKGKA